MVNGREESDWNEMGRSGGGGVVVVGGGVRCGAGSIPWYTTMYPQRARGRGTHPTNILPKIAGLVLYTPPPSSVASTYLTSLLF